MLALTLTALLSLIPAQSQTQEPQAAVVAADQTAEIRPFYDRKTPVLIKLEAGTPVKVVHQNVPWSRVQVPGGLVVWVHKDFVKIDGTVAVVQTSRLRARPMPSTAASSHPVGKLKQDQRLPVLDRKDDWLKVLAPEDLGAWVPSKELTIYDSTPKDWDAQWSAAATKRKNSILAMAKPVVMDDAQKVEKPADEKATDSDSAQQKNVGGESSSTSDGASEKATDSQVGSTNNASGDPAVATAPSDPAASPREPGAAKSPVLKKLIAPAAYAKDVTAALRAARVNLDEHAKEVTTEPAQFSAPVVENCEWVFTEVMLQQKDAETLAQARLGLTRADALRRFHHSAMDAQKRKQDLQKDLASHNASAKVKKDQQIIPEGGTGAYAWVGHLQYRPHQYPKTPFVVVRGKREVLMHSFDGRYYLKDFLGREIAVRGTWRPTQTDSKLQVLSVEELRVLPRAGQDD
jgi:SH3-like domain-containing protein